MQRRIQTYFLLVLLCTPSVWLSGCTYLQIASAVAGGPVLPVLTAPPVYAAPATKGVAVDVETGQPLEGVIVVAYWELKGLHAYPVGLMMVQEGVTDAKGQFVLPAWGPKPRSPLTGQLESIEPRLVAFKSGYKRHYEPVEIPKKKHPQQVIKFKKVSEDSKEYLNGLGFLDDQLEFAFFHHDCSWKQIPRMLVALHLENKRLKAQGLSHSSDFPRSIEDREGDNKGALAKCGSLQEFLRGYLP